MPWIAHDPRWSKLFEGAKHVARRFGFDVRRRRNGLDEANVLQQLFGETSFDLVIDVGANDGQYAQAIREYGYAGPIISFEPLPEAHAKLSNVCVADPIWTVAPRMALGADRGTARMNVAANSASSSLLPMLVAHANAAPYSSYVDSVEVAVHRLDVVLPALMGTATSALLKIDTQGYEDRVLMGAKDILHRCAAVQVEVSLADLYEGQAQSTDLLRWLSDARYRLAYIIPGLHHPTSGRLLQFDGIFLREG